MEDYVATDERPLDRCLNDVDGCDVYVGIFAWRYGFIPNTDNFNRKSITELEYQRAGQKGKRRLIFLLDENTLWPASLKDEHTGEGENGELIAKLRHELRNDTSPAFFRTCDGLALEVVLAVAQHKEKSLPRGRRRELALLKKEQNWVEAKLKGSLYNGVLISLNMETYNQEGNPWALEIELSTPRSGSTAAGINEIFDQANESLLILGEPGSGKTITLLELARDLMTRAVVEENKPIPVVFKLSLWTEKTQSLSDWLIAQLHSQYHIDEKISSGWLKNHRILPLLDGLDDVKPQNRASCIKAINEFNQDTGLAVSCRRTDYESFRSSLRLSGAIRLLPLSHEQIDKYLESVGPKLSAFRAHLPTHRGLRSMAQSPLMLNVMSLAYEDMTELELMRMLAHRQHLFDSYIDRVFTKKRAGEPPYTKNQTINWLSRLARKMMQHDRDRFLIEELQPSWLSRRQFRYYTLCCHLIVGFILVLSFTFIRWWFEGPSLWLLYYALFGIFFAKSLPSFVTFKSFIDDNRRAGRPFLARRSTFAHYLRITSTQIRGAEQLVWNWSEMKMAGSLGLKIGVVVGAILGLFEIVGFVQGRLSLLEFGYHYASDVIVFGIMMMGLVGLLFGVSASISETTSSLNQGIRLSLKNALKMGTISAGIIGFIAFIYLMKPYVPPFMVVDDELLRALGKFNYALYGMVSQGVMIGLLIGMIFGGQSVIRHYVLRLFLFFTGEAPLRLARFLHYASDHILLFRVNGGYEFIHKLLLEHFARRPQSRGN